MKILHINHFKDSYFALPPEKKAELRAGAFAFADKYLKNGKAKMIYNFADGKGSASIMDVESAEELMRIYLEYPVTPYVESKDIPVVEYEVAVKIMREMMAASQLAGKR
jgi:muconolactone delta-isomerase